MELIVFLQVIILGILEGITEFLPISSTAHLLISSKLLNFNKINGGLFETVIQLGAILALCFHYKDKIIYLIKNIFTEKEAQNYSFNIIIAFIPTVILGLLFYDLIKEHLFSIRNIAIMLIIGGIIIIIVEKINIKPKFNSINKISILRSLMIGFCQTIAFIPGTSRSGATIIGSLLLKLDRKTAIEFSFMLAIPTIFSASLLSLYKDLHHINNDNILLILLGFITSFIIAKIVVKFLLKFIEVNGFLIFGYYRILIGFLILLFIT